MTICFIYFQIVQAIEMKKNKNKNKLEKND